MRYRRIRARRLATLALVSLLLTVPWRSTSVAQAGGASFHAAKATDGRGVTPSATLLLDHMEGVFRAVGEVHLSFTLVQFAPNAPRTIFHGQADVSLRDQRGSWI